MDTVNHLSQLRQHIENLELEEQFAAEIRATGFYESFLDYEDADTESDLTEAVSSRPMRQFGKNDDAQNLIRYLHRREKLSARAEFEPHEMDQRLPWKQLKTHPDNMMLFFGPNGIAAAKPTAEGQTVGLGRGDQSRDTDTQLVYDVYYNLNDADGITVEKYTTTRGGLPDKRDQRNPNNIADFIRDRLGVRGRFSAIYIAGRYTKGEERLQDPEKEKQLRDIEATAPKSYRGRDYDVSRAAEKSGLSSMFSGRRSTTVTEPGASVERIKGVMRGIRGDLAVQLADRLLRILPNLVRQAKVRLIRDGEREKAKQVGELDLHQNGQTDSQLVNMIRYSVADRLLDDLPQADKDQAIKDYVRDQLKFVLKDPNDLEQSVEDENFIPAKLAANPDRAQKFSRLRSTITRQARSESLRELQKRALEKAVQGDTATLEKAVNIIRDKIYQKIN